MTYRAVGTILVLGVLSRGVAAQDWAALEELRHKDTTVLVKYLSSLSDRYVGRVLRGVKLSDGSAFGRGVTFLGKAIGLPQGTHVLLISRDGRRAAFAWVDKGGDPLELPDCPAGAVPESAYDIWGEVFTSDKLAGGDGVVEVACTDPAWQPERGGEK